MSRRAKIAAAAAVLGLLWLCTLHVSVPLAGQVPAAAFLLCGELAALAVIARLGVRPAKTTGIARSAGWRAVS